MMVTLTSVVQDTRDTKMLMNVGDDDDDDGGGSGGVGVDDDCDWSGEVGNDVNNRVAVKILLALFTRDVYIESDRWLTIKFKPQYLPFFDVI